MTTGPTTCLLCRTPVLSRPSLLKANGGTPFRNLGLIPSVPRPTTELLPSKTGGPWVGGPDAAAAVEAGSVAGVRSSGESTGARMVDVDVMGALKGT